MDVMKTHGAFSWSELMTPSPSGSIEFYGSLFGWKLETMDMQGGKYTVAKIGDTPVAGMMDSAACGEGAPPMPTAWSCYVTVDNVDEALAKCTSLGGKVMMPAMDVPTVGRMACIQDPQGATISIITYESQKS